MLPRDGEQLRIMGPPLAPGEMRPIKDHSHRWFAAACCPTCGRVLLVSEGDFRHLAQDQDARLQCDRCDGVFVPSERIPDSYRHTQDLWVPRDGWK